MGEVLKANWELVGDGLARAEVEGAEFLVTQGGGVMCGEAAVAVAAQVAGECFDEVSEQLQRLLRFAGVMQGDGEVVLEAAKVGGEFKGDLKMLQCLRS